MRAYEHQWQDRHDAASQVYRLERSQTSITSGGRYHTALRSKLECNEAIASADNHVCAVPVAVSFHSISGRSTSTVRLTARNVDFISLFITVCRHTIKRQNLAGFIFLAFVHSMSAVDTVILSSPHVGEVGAGLMPQREDLLPFFVYGTLMSGYKNNKAVIRGR